MSKVLRRCGAAGLIVSATLIGACEAPLVMDGVEESYAQNLLRSDIVQSVAVSDDLAIFVGGDGLVIEYSRQADDFTRVRLGEGLTGPDLIDVVECSDAWFALGLDGSLWRRAKGDWAELPFDTFETALSLACSGDEKLWASASFATILSSEDLGVTWTEYSPGEDLFLNEIEFPSALVGYSVGEFGTILKTEDGGQSWVRLQTELGEFYPLSAYFDTADSGWVGGLDGAIFSTSDGGVTWQKDQVATSSPIYGISRIGSSIYAVGNSGVVLRQTAYGWNVEQTDIQTFGFLRAIAGDDKDLFVGGQALAKRVPLLPERAALNLTQPAPAP